MSWGAHNDVSLEITRLPLILDVGMEVPNESFGVITGLPVFRHPTESGPEGVLATSSPELARLSRWSTRPEPSDLARAS